MNKTTTQKKDKFIIGVLTIIIIILFMQLFKSCENNGLLVASNKALTSDVKSYALKNGQMVKSQEIVVLEKKTLQENIINKDKELKELSKKFSKIISVQSLKAKTNIPKIGVKFSEPIIVNKTDTVFLTKTGTYYDKWYDFTYSITTDSLIISDFNSFTEIKRIDGFKKKWFLGKKTYHSDIIFTNPNISIENIKTYSVKIPIKWYETRVFNIGIGLMGGFLLAK